MLDAGLKPGFRKIAEGLTQEEGDALEIATIAKIGRLIFGTGPLTNIDDGGMVNPQRVLKYLRAHRAAIDEWKHSRQAFRETETT
jgi:hypothetical protein